MGERSQPLTCVFWIGFVNLAMRHIDEPRNSQFSENPAGNQFLWRVKAIGYYSGPINPHTCIQVDPAQCEMDSCHVITVIPWIRLCIIGTV